MLASASACAAAFTTVEVVNVHNGVSEGPLTLMDNVKSNQKGAIQ